MKRLTVWIAAGVFGALIVYWKRREMADAAVVLAYTTMFTVFLSPVCAAMERRGMRATRAASCAVIGLALIVLLMVAAFIPYMATQTISLFKRLAPIATQLMQQLLHLAEKEAFVTALISEMGSAMAIALRSIAGKLIKAGMTTAAQVGKIAFALVLTYYALCDRKRIGCHLLLLIPAGWRSMFLSTVCACKNALMSYVSGLLKTSAFVAAATCAGLAVLGIEDALLLALMMGILEILPYLGPVLASIPILLSSMLEGGHATFLTLVLLVAVQQIEGNHCLQHGHSSASSGSIRVSCGQSVWYLGNSDGGANAGVDPKCVLVCEASRIYEH